MYLLRTFNQNDVHSGDLNFGPLDLQPVAPPLSYAHSQLIALSDLRSEMSDLEVCLDTPQLFLDLCGLSVGVAKLHLHLIEVGLHLLFDPHGVIPATCLRV